jgi:hypothetical protein
MNLQVIESVSCCWSSPGCRCAPGHQRRNAPKGSLGPVEGRQWVEDERHLAPGCRPPMSFPAWTSPAAFASIAQFGIRILWGF